MNGKTCLTVVLLMACSGGGLPSDEVVPTRPDLGGNTIGPDGAIIGPDGEVIQVDGGFGSLDGSTGSSDGSVATMDGSTSRDGSIVLPDASIVDTQLIRFAHMVPDGPNLRLCFGPPGFPAPLPPLPSQADSPTGVAFRDVTEYQIFPTVGFDDIEARVFSTAAFGATGDCSTRATPLAQLIVRNVSSLSGSHYSLVVTGLANPSATSCPGSSGFPEPCGSGEQVRLALVADSASDSFNTRLRLLHAVPNLRRSIGVCHDPDGSSGGARPTELIAPIPLGAASTYASRTSLTGGSLRFFTAAGCAGTELNELPIPTPFGLVSSFPSIDVNDTYGAGEVTTLFAAGIRGGSPGRSDAYVPVLDLP